MSLKKSFIAGLLALALVVTSALEAAAQLSSLVLLYNDTTGNLSLVNTTNATLGIQGFTVLTTGTGYGGTPLSGRPSNEGWLFTGTNTLPTAQFRARNNVTLENLNGRWSTTGAANVGSNVLTLNPNPSWNPASPAQGPAGSFWSLGNIAPTGWTQTNVDALFFSDPGVVGSATFGRFIFQPQIGEDPDTGDPIYGPQTLGNVLAPTPVPEPSTYALAMAGLACGGYIVRRRRKLA